MGEQVPIPLEFPTPPELTLSRHFAALTGPGRYTAHRSTARVVCEECVWTLHEARGRGPAPREVKTKVTVGRVAVLLCGGHTELWKLRARHV